MTDDNKAQRIPINLDKNALAGVWRLIGAADVLGVLKDVPPAQRPAGFGYALALAESEERQLAAQHMSRILRLAAAQGIDISSHHIFTEGRDGLSVYALPMDLVDQAEV